MAEDPFPDRSMEHRDKIAWMIETNGWALEPVGPRPDADPPIPAYAYSIGLDSGFGFPEVAVFGLTPVASNGLVSLVVALLRDGVRPPIGELFLGLLDGEQRCALLPVDLDEHLDLFETAAAWHRRTSFEVVQLVWPDRNGFLPFEPGFDQRLRFAQPMIGSMPSET
jgi:hypothetical protein